MDLSTLERLPMWIAGRAHAPTTTRYGEVTNPATGHVIRHVPFACTRPLMVRGPMLAAVGIESTRYA